MSENPLDVNSHTALTDREPLSGRRRRLKIWWFVAATLLLLGVGVALLLRYEGQTSRLQAWALVRYASPIGFEIGPGPSDRIRFPSQGPFNERMGYTRIPAFVTRLGSVGFEVTEQVRHNDALLAHLDRGLYAPYAEKSQVGLTVFDCRYEPIHSVRYPHRQFGSFESVPPVITQTLLFIENRDLLNPDRPQLNPAVDWMRFTRAVIGQLASRVNDDFETPGGSTLATQMEKYRHSPAGITHNTHEKLRQMVSAAVRAYQQGENTLPVRRQILLDYINTVPLSAAPSHGEVHGLADGLWVWFGTDLDRVRTLLASGGAQQENLTQSGQILRQVVALMVAHRRPSWYLFRGRQDLDETTDAYLRLLSAERIVNDELRDAALGQRLVFRDMVRNPPLLMTSHGKGSTAARSRLAGWLGTSLYSLDKLDVSVETALHGGLQEAVSDYLGRLADPVFARSQGLLGDRLLQQASLGEVNYSFTLLERTAQGNKVRVQTDSTTQPLDINEGSKLELGSTAKLRVLGTYLELVAELHARLSLMEPEALRATAFDRQDTLTRWAVQHLGSAKDSSLDAMLDAALERRFSADPGERFFTGGGVHTFSNFNNADNGRTPTVREAMQASINLPFVRVVREVVRHTMYQVPGSATQLLEDSSDPRREVYLAQFADREGQTFLRRFWRKTERNKDELRTVLLDGLRPTPERLTAVFRYLEPAASVQELSTFLIDRLGDKAPDANRVQHLYSRFAPDALNLPDRGYVAGVHPLELWLVAYRLQHPQSTLAEAISASESARQAVYGWLFRTRVKSAQDTRIYTLLEVEAFMEIHQRWARQGYPFAHLVPSLATALGSSGDRPAALAELMGIIVNDGVRLPTHHITGMRFADQTPWATALARPPLVSGERVMAPEVARALKQALSDVVERGTARRLAGTFRTSDGVDMSPGGKTGTGDNRIVVRGQAAQALNRTATFVFHLGPQHFGTITAYVVGPGAAQYRFTSGLPVQILTSMESILMPYLDATERSTCAPESP